jgi:hypothetical protein
MGFNLNWNFSSLSNNIFIIHFGVWPNFSNFSSLLIQSWMQIKYQWAFKRTSQDFKATIRLRKDILLKMQCNSQDMWKARYKKYGLKDLVHKI